MRAMVLLAVTCFLPCHVNGATFRDSGNYLLLRDCDEAKAWQAAALPVEQHDSVELLYAARKCAQAGEPKHARALSALAEPLPRQDDQSEAYRGLLRAQTLTALGEIEAASPLLRTTTEAFLALWPSIEEPDDVIHISFGLQDLNDSVSDRLKESDPVAASGHRLLAGRMADKMSEFELATFSHTIAVVYAKASGRPELMMRRCLAGPDW